MRNIDKKTLAREYARYTCSDISDAQERATDENIEYDFSLPIFEWLSKDFCIIPKSKVKEWQLIVEDSLKADRVITEDAWRFMWERLFGKDTFEEEGK